MQEAFTTPTAKCIKNISFLFNFFPLAKKINDIYQSANLLKKKKRDNTNYYYLRFHNTLTKNNLLEKKNDFYRD